MAGCCSCQTKSTTTTADGWWCHLLRIIIPRRDGRMLLLSNKVNNNNSWWVMVSSFKNYNSKEGWPGVSALLGAAASCDIWSPRGAVLYTLVYANTNTELHKYELLRIHLATAKAQFVFTNFIKSIFSLSLNHTCCIALVLQCVWNVATVGDARNDYLQWRHGSDTQTGKATDPCLGKKCLICNQ